jgi:hypothetical protein
MRTLAQRLFENQAEGSPMALSGWEWVVSRLTPADHYFLDMCSDDELGQMIYNDEEVPFVNDNSEIADRFAEIVLDSEEYVWE